MWFKVREHYSYTRLLFPRNSGRRVPPFPGLLYKYLPIRTHNNDVVVMTLFILILRGVGRSPRGTRDRPSITRRRRNVVVARNRRI